MRSSRVPKRNDAAVMGRPLGLVHARVVMVTVGAVLLGSVLVVIPLFDWQPLTWQRFAVVWRERGVLVAVPLLLVSAWQGRSLVPSLLPLGGVGSRSKTAMLYSFAWRLALLGLLSLIPALSVGAARVVFSGAGGPSPVVSVLASLVGVACAAPLGLVLGAVVPRWAWPLSVLVLGLLIWYAPLVLNEVVLANTGLSSRSLSLSWGLDLPVPGLVESASVSLLRITYSSLLVALAFACYLPADSPTRSGHKLTAFFGAVGTWVVVVLGVTLMSPHLPLVMPSGEPLSCTKLEDGRTEVCLFQSHQSLRSTITSIAGPMSQMVGPHMPGTASEDARRAKDSDSVVIPVGLASTEEEYRLIVATSLAEALVGQDACERWDSDASVPSPDYVSHLRTLQAIRDRLVTGSGVEPQPWGVSDDGENTPTHSDEFTRLQNLSDKAFGGWYRSNYERIMACDISPEELP